MPVSDFKVIDFHVHIQPWRQLKPEVLALWQEYHPDFEHLLALADDPKKFVQMLDDQGIEKAALINYVSPEVMGFTEEINEYVSEYCKEFPERLIPCGSLHPNFTRDVAQKMRYLVEDLGIRMLKVHPPHQLFYPNDYLNGNKTLKIIYEKAEEYGVPVMFHTGTSIFPGARVKFGDPICLDDIAIDFPKLKIVLAHGGRPFWTEIAYFLLRRHENIYLDISSFPPQNLLKYFPKFEQIAYRTLFGSDWPGPGVPGIRKNVEKFLELPFSEEIKRQVLYENAIKLLNLK
ncbi:amidohydrolase [Candidatus Acetothermia bacterium]|nr:amidohydrolase [Candidatus Acetothermia bacterium]MBI3460386.1 amidohydrolase [Candidatus Acetothermia bacterium]MBI3661335.1 amidohydrolase [Candidatus Acetothermia bacterium]